MKINPQIFRLSQVIVLFLIFVIPTLSQADRIIRKDGTTLEGKVLSRGEEKITFQLSPGNIKLDIPFSEISAIEEEKDEELSLGDPQNVPEEVREQFIKAENAYKQNNLIETLDHLLQIMDSLDPAPLEVINAFSSVWPVAVVSTDNLAGQEDISLQAAEQYERLFEFTRRRGFDQFLRMNPEWNEVQLNLREKMGELFYDLAVKGIREKDTSKYPAIEESLQKAATYIPQNHTRYYLIQESLGQFYLNYVNKYDEAIQLFKKIYDETSDYDTKQRFYDLMQKARSIKIDAARSVEKTPTPALTPITPDVISRLNPPAPREAAVSYQEEEKPPAEEKAFFDQFVEDVKAKRFSEAGSLLWDKIKTSGILNIIIILVPVIIVFWIIPWIIIKKRAEKADALALRFKIWVRFFGLLALAGYLGVKFSKFVLSRKDVQRCPFCKKPLNNIDSYTDLNFRICPHCNENISPVYDIEDYIFHLVKTVQSTHDRSMGYSKSKNILEKDAMQKLVRAILTFAHRRRASDLHVEPDNEGLKIRARIDGVLYEILNLPAQINDMVVSAIKVMAKLDISEKRIPQDGRISIWVDERDLDLRVSSSPSSHGEKVSIRILDPKDILIDSSKLGMEGVTLERFERSIRKPFGLVLVTGPTGSGKSTTLYVALNKLNTGDKNIVTIEDPIEYKLDGISQQQVHVRANFTFATGLRSILRQDPDIIMVGEIRDRETAEIGIDAATTGHLVFTTLHTIDAPTAFGRMVDLGVPVRRYASVLISIIAQRLIRLNCPDCKRPYKPDHADLDALEIDDTTGIVFIKGKGCDTCNETGYYGRTGIFEILMPDEEMRKFLETDPAVSAIAAMAREKDMRSLREEGIIKMSRGLTTVEEILRVTS